MTTPNTTSIATNADSRTLRARRPSGGCGSRRVSRNEAPIASASITQLSQRSVCQSTYWRAIKSTSASVKNGEATIAPCHHGFCSFILRSVSAAAGGMRVQHVAVQHGCTVHRGEALPSRALLDVAPQEGCDEEYLDGVERRRPHAVPVYAL